MAWSEQNPPPEHAPDMGELHISSEIIELFHSPLPSTADYREQVAYLLHLAEETDQTEASRLNDIFDELSDLDRYPQVRTRGVVLAASKRWLDETFEHMQQDDLRTQNLIWYNSLRYTYNPTGNLASRNEDGVVTNYTYDVFGNLLKISNLKIVL